MGIFSFFSSDNNNGTLNSVADEFRNLNIENLLEKIVASPRSNQDLGRAAINSTPLFGFKYFFGVWN